MRLHETYLEFGEPLRLVTGGLGVHEFREEEFPKIRSFPENGRGRESRPEKRHVVSGSHRHFVPKRGGEKIPFYRA